MVKEGLNGYSNLEITGYCFTSIRKIGLSQELTVCILIMCRYYSQTTFANYLLNLLLSWNLTTLLLSLYNLFLVISIPTADQFK